MAAPIVETLQSAPGGKQWLPYAFQPWASNDPTGWIFSRLPTGMTGDTATGLISGTPTLPGVWNFSVRAGNGDGWSDPVVFTIGVERGSPTPPSGAIDCTIDLATRVVTFDANALLWVKRGDDLIFQLRFIRAGVGVELDLLTFKFSLKSDEGDVVLVAGATWVKIGSGVDWVYRLHVANGSDALNDALDGASPTGDATAKIEDRIAMFDGIAEFEWTENSSAGVGPEHIRSTSRSFLVREVRDLIADALPT